MIQNRVFNRSLSAEEIERRVQKPIPRYRITDRDTPPAVRDRVKGNDLYMFRRQFAEGTPNRTPRKAEPYKPTETTGGKAGVVTPQVQRPSQSEILQRQQSELKQLNARHKQETNKLQEIHKKEIKQPPKGTSLEAIQKRHEAEQRAIAEQHQQEKNLLKQQHEREQKGEVQYYKK
jgi:flagellar biosynthesis GTPase FlhF